jgi:hypothetical protein
MQNRADDQKSTLLSATARSGLSTDLEIFQGRSWGAASGNLSVFAGASQAELEHGYDPAMVALVRG